MRETRAPQGAVIPAQAGIHTLSSGNYDGGLDSRLSGNDPSADGFHDGANSK